ncbi:MAG: DUF4340 domain-containing protein [Rudaea sp.]|nr:DUF4340 domain-containing protein [Rudaea sp.]
MVFLVAAVTLLGVAVYAELAHERVLVPQPLTGIDPAVVRSIEVRCAACRTRRFARDKSGWRMLEPYALPADAEAVARLLAIAHAPVQERHPLHDYDPAKLGLEPAQITLKFDDLVIAIGGENPIDHDRYVRIGDELLRVPDRFGARLLEAPESELDRRPVAPTARISGVGLRGESARRDLASAWQNAVAIGVRVAGTETGGIPALVDLADGSRLPFAVIRSGAGYVVRRADPELDYLFDEAHARELLGERD